MSRRRKRPDYRPPVARRAPAPQPRLEPEPVRASAGSWWPFLGALTLISLVLLTVLLLTVALR